MWRRFLKSEEGVALAYFAVALPALMGVALLVVDVGRGNNLHLDLQNAADSLALAVAAELDGGSDSVDRGNRAAETLVGNQARFGDDGAFILDDASVADVAGNFRVYYLKSIPDDDVELIPWMTAFPGEVVTDVEAAAGEASDVRFAAVFAEPVDYSLLFPASFLGDTDVTVGANAVAGFRSVVCDFTPMFICNPYEDPDNPGTSPDLEQIVANLSNRRKMIEMRQKGPSAPYAPGNFGYLSSPEGNTGANQLREMFALTSPNACYDADGVDLRPGQVASVRVAVNVRFDVYEGSYGGNSPSSPKNNANYRPAKNVRKGYDYTGNACNAAAVDPPEPANFMALPRDNCFPDSCTEMGGRMGNGFWDIEAYWQTNFGTAPPNGWSNTSPPTRYEAYRWEIDHPPLVSTASAGGEVGIPACYYNPSGTTDDPDRRIVYAALINCLEHEDEMNGSAEDIPVVEFASFFLTEPVESGGPDDDVLRAEIVDVTGVFGAGSLEEFQRDDVQLYR